MSCFACLGRISLTVSASVDSTTCRQFCRHALYPGGVGTLVDRVKEFATLVDRRFHRLSVSVIFGISIFLQPSVELEVAPCSVFFRSIVELSQRVLNFDESGLWPKQFLLQE